MLQAVVTTISESLQVVLSAIQADGALVKRLQTPSSDQPLQPLLEDLLSALVNEGRITPAPANLQLLAEQLQDELEALLESVQPLSDAQLEAIAAGRMDLGSLLCMLAGSVSFGMSDGAAFFAASTSMGALAGAPLVASVWSPAAATAGATAGASGVAAAGAEPAQLQSKPGWMAPTLAIIKEFEGLELQAYVDAVGVVTIGWGTTLYEDGRPVSLDDTITAHRAEQLLVGSILREYAPGVFEALPMAKTMAPEQQAALISFTYNVGINALNDSTMRCRLLAGEDPERVIRQELPRWCFGDGRQVLAGLVRRRAAEVALFSGA